MTFTHLHLHTVYSFLDGANTIENTIKKAKELNMNSIAITDHNHIGGWFDFLNLCNENNIKPILGCEMYQTWDTDILKLDKKERDKIALENAIKNGIEIPKKATKKAINELIADYLYDSKQYHLVILAMNQKGVNNLIKLQSEAANKCTYNGRYLCDFDMLEKYNEGLIVLSACLSGMIPHCILNDKIDKAYELAKRYKEIFGDRFYLEIQPLYIDKQEKVNKEIIEMAQKLNIQLVATNDCHYTNEEDWDDHDTLLCVGTGKFKDDENRMKYSKEFWIRSEEEMYKAFERHKYLSKEIITTAINNTALIANRIEKVKLGADKPLFPKVEVPKGLTPEKYLTIKTYNALYKYYLTHKDINIHKYEKRLDYELDIINTKGYAPYILKILENIDFCKANDIPLGPGRGSAAGSLVLFVNGGTKIVDPIKYNLLFFRFLTKDRQSPPDVDQDYSYCKRPILIKHLEEQHGQECVSHIGTYTELGVKSGLKDFGRVLRYPFDVINQLNKQLDIITEEEPSIKFKDIDNYKNQAEEALELGDENTYNKLLKKYNDFKKLEDSYPELFRLARKFEGTPRNMGVA